MKKKARAFKALGDETRLKMMALLRRRGELCVCDFVSVLGITQSKASRHLRYLHNAGLVDDRRNGVWVHYKIPDEPENSWAKTLAQAVEKVCDDAVISEMDAKLDKWLDRKKRCAPVAPTKPGRSK
jgi:ArsR family transcriptional regulator